MICYLKMDLSLDDIIKKNNLGKGNKTRRGRLSSGPNNKRSFGSTPKKISQSNGKVIKRHPLQSKDRTNSRASFPNKKGGVIDARLKIIQKNRQRLTDARDKLSQLAKQTDARAKIKGRSQQLIQRTDRRGERVQETRKRFDRVTPQQTILQRSIRNTDAFKSRDPSSLIRCTINRTDLPPRPFEEEMEIDSHVPVRLHNDLNNIQIVAQNDYQHYRQEYPLSQQEPIYVDHYDQQPVFTRQLQPSRELMVGRSGGRMSQEMRARLDTPAKPPQYSFAQAPQNPPPSLGHRIVVSNLHPSVTHEDIKELFEDIGPLLTSRLVRAGTAEVIYKLQKDAKKAVEAYHNRQLDGQPMKCLLVNPRSPAGSSGVLRSNNMPAAPKFPVSSKSMVVPDLSAIHKALFTYK